jgi:hypothetical protein
MGFFRKILRRRKDKKNLAITKNTDKDDSPDTTKSQQNITNGKAAPGPDTSVGGSRPILSPRNLSVPHMDEAPPMSPAFSRKSGPVDLDDEDLLDDLNNENSTDHSSDNDMMQQKRPVFEMPNEEARFRFSAGQMHSSDNSHSDGEDSSFNLSTDAEDTDYENLRRRGVLPPTLMETSSLSAASATPTAASQYQTDEGSVFPDLGTDDDLTRGSLRMGGKGQQQNKGLLHPSLSQDSSDDAWNSKEPAMFQSTAPTALNQSFTVNSATAKLSPTSMYQGQSTGSPIKRGFTSPVPSNNHVTRKNFTSPKNPTFKEAPASWTTETDFANDFANFADFNNVSFPSDPIWAPYRNVQPSVRPIASSKPTQYTETSLSELLAQAKSKSSGNRARRSGESVNSAPAMTASYIRQQHSLRPVGASPRVNHEITPGASVSDIIQSLEAANSGRKNGGSVTSGLHRRSTSRGDDLSAHSRDTGSVRSTKERLRRRREEQQRTTGDSSESEDTEASENWLVDEVTGALGPRGIAADLESLSGRSNRSRSSGGGRSNRSHRSHRSHQSMSRRRGKTSGGESISSHGSRRSRYSHRSTRSYISQMSEQSRSVANDLLRLEMQLAMVGSAENATSGTSVGGNSRRSATRPSGRRSNNSARRTRITVLAPAGKLGIILVNKADGKGTVVSGVRTSSVMAEKISPGDRIVAIDGEDVSLMTVSEITTIMARKSEFERTLTVLTTPRQVASNDKARSPRAGDYDFRYRGDH